MPGLSYWFATWSTSCRSSAAPGWRLDPAGLRTGRPRHAGRLGGGGTGRPDGGRTGWSWPGGTGAGPAVGQALDAGLGAGWRDAIDAGLAARLRRRLPGARIFLLPLFVRRGDVERVANLRFGNAGRWNLLDLYCHRFHPSGGPMLVYLHGGAFRSGRKNREAGPLLYRLASQGWCARQR